MESKLVCLLLALVCLMMMTSQSRALPVSGASRSDALDVASDMAHALDIIMGSIRQRDEANATDNVNGDSNDKEPVFRRGRRMVGGVGWHGSAEYNYGHSGRPRIYRPRYHRPRYGDHAGSTSDISSY